MMSSPKKRRVVSEESVPRTDRSKGSATATSYRPPGKLQKIREQVPEGLKISRKALRKQMRKMKKVRRHAFYAKNTVSTILLMAFFR